MKFLRPLSLFVVLTLSGCPCGKAQTRTFSGNSPCGGYVKSLLGIPVSADCDRVQWKATLLQNTETRAFQLNVIYGMQEQSGPGFAGGGTQKEIAGKWKVTQGTPVNPQALVYELEYGGHTLRFLQLDGSILHLLYTDRNLMIGDAGWSYTLHKVNNPEKRPANE